MAQKPPAEVRESEPEFVRFIGAYNYREITEEQWARAGVPDHPTVTWNSANGWTVPRSDLKLDDEQFARIITADAYFRVVTGEDTKVPKGVYRFPPALA